MVLATIGPSDKSFQESLSTLQFAARCKEIQLTPINHASIIEDDEEVSQLKERIMQIESDYRDKESEMRGVIEAKEQEIQRMQQEVFMLRE